jgi:hypothetical protein
LELREVIVEALVGGSVGGYQPVATHVVEQLEHAVRGGCLAGTAIASKLGCRPTVGGAIGGVFCGQSTGRAARGSAAAGSLNSLS